MKVEKGNRGNGSPSLYFQTLIVAIFCIISNGYGPGIWFRAPFFGCCPQLDAESLATLAASASVHTHKKKSLLIH